MNQNLRCSILNAIVIAAIVFISTLSIDFPPTLQNLWAAGIGGSLAFLTQVKSLLQETSGNGGAGGMGEEIHGVPIVKSGCSNRIAKLGMLIS